MNCFTSNHSFAQITTDKILHILKKNSLTTLLHHVAGKISILWCSNGFPGSCLCSFSEIVGEPARKMTKMAHASSSRSLPPNCLHTPIVTADSCGRVSTSRAPALLNVKTSAPTTPAQRVRLVPSLTETARSLRHGG